MNRRPEQTLKKKKKTYSWSTCEKMFNITNYQGVTGNKCW